MKPAKPFEKSKADAEPKNMKEGSKKEEAMDRKQMQPTKRAQRVNRAQVI